jgi:hypothetical protein
VTSIIKVLSENRMAHFSMTPCIAEKRGFGNLPARCQGLRGS